MNMKEAIDMIESWNTTIPSLTGQRPRRVWVWVPDSAMFHEDYRFPVLYMFDGHNLFYDDVATYGKSWGLREYMEETSTPLIIVGVDCNHGPNFARLSEYSPFTFHMPDHDRMIRGRGRAYMNWLIYSLKPMIDRRYPTLPGRETTFIAGSSMGGLMSLYAVTAYNSMFSRAAALSPSVWVASNRLCDMIDRSQFAAGTVVYMDYGERELENHDGMLHHYIDTVSALMSKGVLLTSRIVPNGDHCEASWENQIPFFLSTLLYEGE